MKNFLFSFLVVLSVAAFANEENGQNINGSTFRKQGFRVMTYNIHHCNPPSAGDKIDVEAIAKVIHAEKPDFVALQEVDVNTERSGKGKNQAQQLAELTGMQFYFSKAIDHQGGEYGVAVLSRFPVLDSVKYSLPIHADKPEENRTIAAITVMLPSRQKMIFASTHLGLKEANRLLQAETIISHFGKTALPMILAGDFNAVPESPVMAVFNPYFASSCSDCKPTIPVENPSKTIDFILYKKGNKLKSLGTRVMDEKYASDHLPVVADFVFE
ncbi:endonuclease/exonuclease/phosphatase family protein [Dyadobacter sediminis]|uniref:Endonuclease n=1 Tax=Dyadobacter sediminis TaxID=1493691 RepID=A0A5R9KEL3_9BACT|nr:endonuclease/exonuclease/phosphatase family protein [Dyadobacter sediminis]TLU94549.1 endonuclease [Dyadobacter sediminis]GGB90265.1 endonuclease [Dyadobacter sediminis]